MLEPAPHELDAALGQVDAVKLGSGARELHVVGAEADADLEHGPATS